MTHSYLANPRRTKEVMDGFGLSAKHSLGQNFLIDDNVIGKILHMSGVDSMPEGSNESVLEIGPGIGTLTVAMLEHAKVIAIERDDDLLCVLDKTTEDFDGRLHLIHDDALKVTAEEIDHASQALDASIPEMLVSNLPYGIAATVILDQFERFSFIRSMTVMVQSEVADRICASPCSKEYGAYTVKLSLLAHAVDRFQVPPSCFMPAPHVESSVIRLERNTEKTDPALIEAACDLADAAFAQRRKTIRNSMQSRYPRDVVDELLSACNILPTTRGETLDPEVFLEMAHAFMDH